MAAAVGAWLSLGALAVTSEASSAARIGLLPPVWSLELFVAVAVGVMAAWRPEPARTLPLFLSLLLWLPWLPGPIPASFLLWTGPVVWLVWTAIVVSLFTSSGVRVRIARGRWLSDPRRVPLTACLIALLLSGIAFWRVSPLLPGGDEPHYLMITQSLLYDGDLQIENNHDRGDYREYFAGALRPDFLRRGQNGQIYSVHAPGLAALIAPAFVIGGHHGVAAFLALLSAAGAGLAWHVAYIAAGSVAAAWFGWAVVFMSAPWLVHTFMVYPDGPAGVLMLAGVWCLMRLQNREGNALARRWPLVACGAAMAFLPWLHTRYAVLAGVIGVLVLARLAGRPGFLQSAVSFLVVPVVSAAAWFSFFYIVYGSFDPLVPYGGLAHGVSAGYVLGGLTGLLFDQQFGLLPNAPAYVCAFVGLGMFLFRARLDHGDGGARVESRLGWELLVIMVPYLVIATTHPMWWGGLSPPARFTVPVLLMLVIPASLFWVRARARTWRYLPLVAVGLNATILATMVLVERGFLIFNSRDGFSLWLGWVNRVVDLPTGLPSHHQSGGMLWVHVASWAFAIGAVVFALRAGARRGRLSEVHTIGVLTLAGSAVATMAGLQMVWWSNGVTGLAPTTAQLNLLDAFRPVLRPVGVTYSPLMFVSPEDIPPRMRIRPSDRIRLRGNVRVQPRATFPRLPAGLYRLHVDARTPSGRVVLRVGRTGQTIEHVALAELATRSSGIDVKLPVRAHSLQVYSDEEGRDAIRDLWLEPEALWPATLPLARRAVRYGSHVVFFLDENVFEEEAGFWVRGERAADLILMPSHASDDVTVFLRNGGVANDVELTSGDWRVELSLDPGDTRALSVPVDLEVRWAVVRVASGSGFRPVDVNQNSDDPRFLGLWVELQKPVSP